MKTIQVHPVHMGISVAFLIEGPAGLVLVDAGLRGSEGRIWAKLAERRFRREDLTLIVLTHTHPDHAGGLPALIRDSGATLAAHPRAGEFLQGEPMSLPHGRQLGGRLLAALYPAVQPLLALPRLEPDLSLEDGDLLDYLGLPATILHTPGHTADSITLLLDDGTAFVGDLLVRRGQEAYPQPYLIEDEQALQASLARLRERQPRIVYVGHSSQPLTLSG